MQYHWKKLKEKKILFVLVSARPLYGMLSIVNELGLTGFPIASLNGACITINDSTIFESTIDLDTLVDLEFYISRIPFNANIIKTKNIIFPF